MIGHCRDIKTGVYMYVSAGRKLRAIVDRWPLIAVGLWP